MPHTISKNFDEFSQRMAEHLSSRYGDFVAHLLEFATTDAAVGFLRSLSFVSGAELRTPDHIQAAVSANQEGKDAVVVIGGQFTIDENEEIRRRADASQVKCENICVASHGSNVQRDFFAAAARLQGTANSREPESHAPSFSNSAERFFSAVLKGIAKSREPESYAPRAAPNGEGWFMMRKWQCTNPGCEDRRNGIVAINAQPAYAKVLCDKCGAVMNPVAGPDDILFVGGYSDKETSAGALPVNEAATGLSSGLIGRTGAFSINDPDVQAYPTVAEFRANPTVLVPDLFTYIQGADTFIVRAGDRPLTMVVARCPSHHLATPYSDSLPVGLHVEAHDVEGWLAFCIYVLVWDNPREPWFVEHALFPYDMVGANEEDLALPTFSQYSWRQLFYLLSGGQAALMLVNERNTVIGSRIVDFGPTQRKQLASLIGQLNACSDRKIHKPDYFRVLAAKNRVVDIKEVQSRFPRPG